MATKCMFNIAKFGEKKLYNIFSQNFAKCLPNKLCTF